MKKYRKAVLWLSLLAIVACVILAACLLRKPAAGDHLVLTDSPQPDHLSYDIQLGTDAMSGEIYVEQWVYGTCVRSAPVVVTKYVDSIDIIMNDRREDGVSIGTDIQIDTGLNGGSLSTYFAHPEDMNILGWGFGGYEVGGEKKLAAGDEVILAAKTFDTGSGVRVFDSETLIAEPERLETAAYMIVVRAVFSSDSLGVTGHSEADQAIETTTPSGLMTQ